MLLQMESIALHNALMLLGEESSSNGRQRGKKEGKKGKAGAAAKLGNKSKKAAGQKRPAVKVRKHPPFKHLCFAFWYSRMHVMLL